MNNTHIKPSKKQVALSKRVLTAYEYNHLIRHGVSPDVALSSESPVEYLTGFCEFCDLEFVVSPATLIPRIETEELVSLVLEDIAVKQTSSQKITLFDIGTGSGAIAIAISNSLHKQKKAHAITAVDISREALEIAQKNIQRLSTEPSSIKLIHSDLLTFFFERSLPQPEYIIANLPYIPSRRLVSLDPSVIDFEPHLALDGGIDGLELVQRLLMQAESILKPGGSIFLEVDYEHTLSDIQKLSSSHDFTVSCLPSTLGGATFCILNKKI